MDHARARKIIIGVRNNTLPTKWCVKHLDISDVKVGGCAQGAWSASSGTWRSGSPGALTVRAERDAALGERDVHRMLEKSIADRCAWTLRMLGMEVRARHLVDAGPSS